MYSQSLLYQSCAKHLTDAIYGTEPSKKEEHYCLKVLIVRRNTIASFETLGPKLKKVETLRRIAV